MKPFTFLLSVSTLIFVLMMGYFYFHHRATLLYSGEATGKVVCSSMSFLCSNEIQNSLQNASSAAHITDLQASRTKQGRVLTLLSGSGYFPQGVGARAMNFIRFFYDTLTHRNELPFFFNPQEIAWYVASRDVGSTIAALAHDNTVFSRLLEDISQEYRVSLMSLAARIHDVHVVKFAGDNDYALIVRDHSPAILDIGVQIEGLVAHALAATFPQEVSRRLPDSSSATELIFNPSRFVFVPKYQGTTAVHVLRDDTHHVAFYDAIIGDRFIMTTSQTRLQELMKVPSKNTVWHAISRGCDSYSSSVAHDRIFLNLAQGFWYGAHDAHDMHTIAGCFMDAAWLGRISDRQKLTFPSFHL